MDTERWILDTIEFDRAIGVAKQFAKQHPDTLVIVTADHECARRRRSSARRGSPTRTSSTRSTRASGTSPGGPRNGVVGTYEAAGVPALHDRRRRLPGHDRRRLQDAHRLRRQRRPLRGLAHEPAAAARQPAAVQQRAARSTPIRPARSTATSPATSASPARSRTRSPRTRRTTSRSRLTGAAPAVRRHDGQHRRVLRADAGGRRRHVPGARRAGRVARHDTRRAVVRSRAAPRPLIRGRSHADHLRNDPGARPAPACPSCCSCPPRRPASSPTWIRTECTTARTTASTSRTRTSATRMPTASATPATPTSTATAT